MKRIRFRVMAAMSLVLSGPAMAAADISTICGDCKPVKIARCGGFLEGPTHDDKGQLWVVDVTGGRVLQISGGQCVDRGKSGGHPNGALATSDGKLLIADWSGLLSFDPKTGRFVNLDLNFEGEKLTGLNDLALDKRGGLYFTVPGKSSAIRPEGRLLYRAADGKVTLIGNRFAYPNGLAVAADGETLLVSDFATKRIMSIPAVGASGPLQLAYVFAYTQGGVGPDGMKLDDKGRLFVANLGTGGVQVYGTRGEPIGEIKLPNDAGAFVTNVTLQDGALFITEAARGEIWRVNLRHESFR